MRLRPRGLALSARGVRGLAVVLGLSLAVGGGARAQDEEPGDGLRRPERLTVGVSDQLLGTLSPNGQELVFISNRNRTSEVYRQDLASARAQLGFDEAADVSWPRLSPDGKLLAYVSYRDDAAGTLCVRELRPLADKKAGKRRCLDDGTSAVQAEWIDAHRIALVARRSVQGDLELDEVKLAGRRLTARKLLSRNMTSPAVSSDGRWVVYVPIERYVADVGPSFAARAAGRLEAARLDRPEDPPIPLPLDLPGVVGQPAFGKHAQQLYVTQFVDDSNHDGVIDAADHGVLFRVPFSSGLDDAPERAARALPEQLTDAAWSCQYPAPGKDLLIATCSRGTQLDVYSLPLDGEVPESWTIERLRSELALSNQPVQQLLLYRHLLARVTDKGSQRAVFMNLLRLHLQLDEFDAAAFYARKLPGLKDPATNGVSKASLTLVEHRRAVRARERGQVSLELAAESRARMQSLDPTRAPSPAGAVMRRVVRSEIADDLGDLDTARAELEAAPVDEVDVPSVLRFYYDRADALYRRLDEREPLVAAARRLGAHPRLSPTDRLRYARAAAEALVRGLPFAEAEAQLAQARAKETPGSELDFAFQLESALLGIRDDDPPKAVRDALVALYQAQTSLDRKRTLVLEAGQRAADLDAEKVMESLAQRYVADVPKGTGERRRADLLYRRAVEGRAYRRWAKGHLEAARNFFHQVAEATGSFESHIGYLEVRLQEGAKPAELVAEYGGPNATEPTARFVRAYLIVRSLPELDGPAHAKAVAQAIALLRGAWPELKARREVHALYGAALHESYLMTGDSAQAQRANVRYLVALELSSKNTPRFRAMVLGQLAALQASVGNFHIALSYLEDREKLSFVDGRRALVHLLEKARVLHHLDREEDAAKAADAAVSAVAKWPATAEFRPLVLDRAALVHLSAGHYARALELYDAVTPELAKAHGPLAERNRVTTRLGRAAAALGAEQPARALDDLAYVDARLSDPQVGASLRWPHTPPDEVLRSYRLLAAGLRAHAHRALGQLAETARALETRRALLEARLEKTGLDEHLRALALIEAQLADLARDRKDPQGAQRWLASALGHSDTLGRRSRAALDTDGLDLLWLATDLRLSTGQPGAPDLPARLRKAHDELAHDADPMWRRHQRWFEVLEAMEPEEKRGDGRAATSAGRAATSAGR